MTIATYRYKSQSGECLVAAEYTRLLGEWPNGARRFHIPSSLGDTFVIACGDETAAPVVLLHGGGGNSSMWLEYIGRFERHYHVYCIDLPGEPGFSASSRAPFTTDAYATWLDDILTGLSIARPSIVGASLGGWLALDYASRHVDRVNRLVLLGPMGVARVRPSFMFTTMPLLLSGEWGRQRALRKIVVNTAPFPDQYLLSLIQTHFQARMTPIPVLTDEALKALSMPVLAIVGDKDVIVNSQETERRLNGAAADARVLRLPGAGHRIFGHADEVIGFLQETV